MKNGDIKFNGEHFFFINTRTGTAAKIPAILYSYLFARILT